MKTKRMLLVGGLALTVLSLAACDATAPAAQPTAVPVEAPVTVQAAPQGGGSSGDGGEGQDALDNLPTAAPPTEPAQTFEARPVFLDFQCDPLGQAGTWCLVSADGARTDVAKPLETAQFMDFAPATGRVLFGGRFPDHGAGPGNLAVTDLRIFDIGSGGTAPVVDEEIVVKARFAPNGEDLAYIRATATTYELVWRSAIGSERVLAVDVPHTLSFSPSGDRVAFTRESRYEVGGTPGIYAVSVESGQEVMLSEADRAGAGSSTDTILWSFDGGYVMVPVNLDTVVAATDGSGSARLAFDESLGEEAWVEGLLSSALWHPGGQHIVANFESMGPGVPEPGIRIVLLELNESRDRVVGATVVTDDGILRGWHVPGESVWVNTFDTPGPVQSVDLPG